jgi:hypothetical protein
MALVFIAHADESGDAGWTVGESSPYYIEGGFLVDEVRLASLETAVAAVIERNYPQDEHRVKGRIRNTLAKATRDERRPATRYVSELFGVLAEHDAVVFAAVLVKPIVRPPRVTLAVRNLGIRALLGQIQSYAQHTGDSTFTLVHDNFVNGNNYGLASYIRAWRLHTPGCRLACVRFESSKHPLIQAADHVIGPVLFSVCWDYVTWAWEPRGKVVAPEVRRYLHRKVEPVLYRRERRASVEIHDLGDGSRTPLPLP